jgi:hypothetical protein
MPEIFLDPVLEAYRLAVAIEPDYFGHPWPAVCKAQQAWPTHEASAAEACLSASKLSKFAGAFPIWPSLPFTDLLLVRMRLSCMTSRCCLRASRPGCGYEHQERKQEKATGGTARVSRKRKLKQKVHAATNIAKTMPCPSCGGIASSHSAVSAEVMTFNCPSCNARFSCRANTYKSMGGRP